MSKFLFAASLLAAAPAFAEGFIEDATVEIQVRNFYVDRNYTEESKVPANKDWAQGVIIKANSGYTPGPIGFGIDVLAMGGVKLKADKEHGKTGLIPRDNPIAGDANDLGGKPRDVWGEIGITGKAKVSQTELKIGTLQPMNPVFVSSQARLLPQTYRGAFLQTKDVPNANLQAAWLNRVNHRDSTNYEKIKISGVNGRFKPAETDAVYFLGGDYNFTPAWKLSAFYLNVDDLYDQQFAAITNDWKLSDKTNLNSQVRYYRSRDEGKANAGQVDNDLIHTHFELKHVNQKFIFSTMHHFGNTAFPYLSDTEAPMTVDTWTGEFLNPKERAYSARYEYDFKDYVPGLRFMTRYSKGTHIHAPHLGGTNLKERELDFDVGYTVQKGPLKNLGLRARYAVYGNNMTPAANIKPARETRVNIDYTYKF